MQVLTPPARVGIAGGVPHLIGFRLDFLDLTDPQDAPLPLIALPGGAVILGAWANVLIAFDDGAASAISLALTFGDTADAFASLVASTLSTVESGTAGLIGTAAPDGAQVLGAPATLGVGSTSAAVDPYTAGSVDLWILVAETNG